MCKMGMAVLASVLAGLLLLAALPASASAELAGFQCQREIMIQENSGETLRDFPEEAQADGDDTRFTDADGREPGLLGRGIRCGVKACEDLGGCL